MPNIDANSDTLSDSFVKRYQDYKVHKVIDIRVN